MAMVMGTEKTPPSQAHGVSIQSIAPVPGLPVPMDLAQADIDDTLDLPTVPSSLSSRAKADQLEAKLNYQQKLVFDTIIEAVNSPGEKRCFFLQASGGTGKTFTYS